MGAIPSALLRLLLPGLVLATALWFRPLVDQLAAEWRFLLENLPYVLAIFNLVAALQFKRLRLMLAAIGVAVLYWLIQSHLQVSLEQPGAARVYLSASLCVPAVGFFLLLLPERGVLNPYGLAMAAACICIAALAWPVAGRLLVGDAGFSVYFQAHSQQWYAASTAASVLVVLACLLGLGRLLRYGSEADAAIILAVLSAHTGLAWLSLDHISVVTAVAGELCLAWGLLRSSHTMAYRDELTGLLGRRALNERLKTLGRRYSIAMLDVDHFKRFNDTHGHEVGDDVLRLVASRVKAVGAGGTAYRYGGEEFCIVFPRRDPEDCAAALEQLRECIADYKLSLRDRRRRPVRSSTGSRRRGATRLRPDQVSVTISAGIAARDERRVDPLSVIKAADAQLYRAKRAGRNRVSF